MDIKEDYQGLSIRAMTMIGVLYLEKYCREKQIDNSDLSEFKSKMLELLTTDDIPKWDNECNQINITGLGDPLPEKLIKEYPEHQQVLDLITQSIREISAVQLYGKWNSQLSHEYLERILGLSELNIELNLSLFKRHFCGEDGWGYQVPSVLFEEWSKSI